MTTPADTRRIHFALAAILLLGGALRLTGLDWGTEAVTGEFRPFHPDEVTLIANAKWIGEDVSRASTAYGHLPAYILTATHAIVSTFLDYTPHALTNDDLRTTHIVARALSGLAGVLTIWVVYLLATRCDNAKTGLLSAAILALTPSHIQQSHYYTVDVSITLFTALGLLAILRLPRDTVQPYLLCGLAVGATASYRLLGGLLVVPYVIAHLYTGNDTIQTILSRFAERVRVLFSARSLVTAAIVLIIATASTPFLILNQGEIYEGDDQRDFAPSVEVVVGKEIRMWTLYDFSTTPYLFYLTDLLPTAQGAPIYVASLLGLVWALRRRTWDAVILLAWIVPYFLVVGGLFTKPIRYTMPMLPALSLFAAWGTLFISRRMAGWQTHLYTIPLILLFALTAPRACAIASVFTTENIRYEARREIKRLVPDGSIVYSEGGGFPTQWMVPEGSTALPDMGSFFVRARGGVLDVHVLDFVRQALNPVDYWVLIRENRARQYQAARSHYKLGAAVFDKLYAGELGFEHLTSVRRPPAFAGINFDESGAEPSVTGFDRPTIDIFRKTSFDTTLIRDWEADILEDPTRPDGAVVQAADLHRRRKFIEAAEILEDIIDRHTDLSLPRMLLAEVYLKLGRGDESMAQVDAAQPTWWDAVGLVELGLKSIGTDYLYRLLMQKDPSGEQQFLRGFGARQLFEQGLVAFHEGNIDSAQASYGRAIELDGKLHLAHRNLGALRLSQSEYALAASSFGQAAALYPKDAEIWLGLAASRVGTGDLRRGWDALRQALAIDPEHPEHTRLQRHISDLLVSRGESEAARAIRGFQPRGGRKP